MLANALKGKITAMDSQMTSVHHFFSLLVIAGLLLIPLLPIGSGLGMDSLPFQTLFILHLAFTFLAFLKGVTTITQEIRESPFTSRLLIGFAIISLSLSCLEALLPITFRDALIHHIAVPQWWIEKGFIYPIEWHEWSYYPMIINLAFTGFLELGLDAALAPYHWLLHVLFCMTLFIGTKEALHSSRAATYAFLLSATLPILHRLAPIPLVDSGLALYASVAFFALIADINARKSDRLNKSSLLIAGAALGLALSTKYNGLLFVVSFILLFPFLRAKARTSVVLKEALILSLIAFVVYLPWPTRNYSLTGNPIYPLYSNLFKPTIERPAGLPSLKPFAQRVLLYNESPLQIALTPLRIFFEGEDNVPAHFDGVLSPIILLGLFAALCYRKDRRFSFALFLSIFYFSLAFFLNPLRLRYLLPIFAPLIFLSAGTLEWLSNRRRFVNYLSATAIASHLIFFTLYAKDKIASEQLIPFLNGQISNESYLLDRVPEFKMIQYSNKQATSSEGKIYLLFTGNRFALYNNPTFSGGHYSESYLHDWIRASTKNKFPLLASFKSHQIGFILSNSLKAQEFALKQLNPEEQALWIDFNQKHLKFIHEENGYSLWQVIE